MNAITELLSLSEPPLSSIPAEIDRLIDVLRDMTQERRTARHRRDGPAPQVNVQQQLDACARAAAETIYQRRH